MEKAGERAKERYWLEPCNIDTQNKHHAYIEGYHQAEKDLALKWEDFERIDDIFIAIRLDGIDKIKNMTNKEFYQKVLDRFNKQKKNNLL